MRNATRMQQENLVTQGAAHHYTVIGYVNNVKALTIVRTGETNVTLMLIKIVQEGEIEYAVERRVYIAMNKIEDDEDGLEKVSSWSP